MTRHLNPLFFLFLLFAFPSFGQQFFDPNPSVSVQPEKIKPFVAGIPEIATKAEYYNLSKPVLQTLLAVQSNCGKFVADGQFNYARILPNKRLQRFEAFTSTKNGFVSCDKRSRGVEAAALCLHFLRANEKAKLSDAQWLTLVFGPGGDLASLSAEAEEVYRVLTGEGFGEVGAMTSLPATVNEEPKLPEKTQTAKPKAEVQPKKGEGELAALRAENERLKRENEELRRENKRLENTANPDINSIPFSSNTETSEMHREAPTSRVNTNEEKVTVTTTSQSGTVPDRIDFADLTNQSKPSEQQQGSTKPALTMPGNAQEAMSMVKLQRVGLLGLFRTPYDYLYEDFLAGGVLAADASIISGKRTELGGTFRLGYAAYREASGGYYDGQGLFVEAGPYFNWIIQDFGNGATGLSFVLPITFIRIREERGGFRDEGKTAVSMPFWNLEIEGWKQVGHFHYGIGIGILPVLGTTVRLAYEF